MDKGHGQLEIRCYWISSVLNSLPDTSEWTGLNSIGLLGEEQPIEQRYFINSIPANAKQFTHAVRGHWGS